MDELVAMRLATGLDENAAREQARLDFDRAQRYYDELQANLPDHFFHRNAFRDSKVEEFIFHMTWQMLVAKTETFITSNNPVVLPKEGLAHKPALVFPLSASLCLCASGRVRGDADYAITYQVISGSEVLKVNRMVAAAARGELYANHGHLPDRFIRQWMRPPGEMSLTMRAET